MEKDTLKRMAAEAAAEQVTGGMVVGLGTGSTAEHVVDILAEKVAGQYLGDIACVPTSASTEQRARAGGLRIVSLAEVETLDLAIDGADEIGPNLDLIKGLGGAFLREKLVESRARRFIVVADDSKLVEKLGTQAPVPVEIAAPDDLLSALMEFGCTPKLRYADARPFVTDNGNQVVDCFFRGGIDAPEELATALDAMEGILAHGLFLGMASEAFVGSAEDGVQHLVAETTKAARSDEA